MDKNIHIATRRNCSGNMSCKSHMVCACVPTTRNALKLF